MKNRRDRNDTDVLIETYTIRIQNHKAKIKELKNLKKQLQDKDRIEKIDEEIIYEKECVEEYRYDVRRLKRLLKRRI